MSTKFLNTTRSDIHNIRHDTDSVEIRMIQDPNHPDYDPRVDLPLDRELMASIRMVGQLEPASGYQVEGSDGKKIIHLLFGRQRWKAIREIWDEMRENEEDMAFAPVFRLCLQRDEGVAAKRQKRIIENRHRQALDGLALAREVAAHLAIVGEDDQALEATRVLFNFKSIAALRNNLEMLETTPKVQAEIVAGTISPTAALHLARQSADVQDAVVDLIQEQSSELEDQAEDKQIDAFEAEEQPRPSEPAKATKPVSVSTIDGMIRETKGQATYEMVTIKLVEKRLEKVADDLDKALNKLEDCREYAKKEDLAARVAKLQGWDEALRWARGETTASGKGAESQGNDKMSAAWQVLAEALTSAQWPRVLESRQAADFPEWIPSNRQTDPDYENRYREECNQAQARQGLSRYLVIAGEVVAKRSVGVRGVTESISVNMASKWFTRLMDPYGKISKLVREWGAHEWLTPQGKNAGLPSYKSRYSQYGHDMAMIEIAPKQVERLIAGTPLGTPRPVDEMILEIVRDHVGAEKSSDVSRDSLFGSPWKCDPEHVDEYGREGAIGPHLGDDDDARDYIIDEIWTQLEVTIPEPNFATVGELIDHVSGVIAQREAGHGA